MREKKNLTKAVMIKWLLEKVEHLAATEPDSFLLGSWWRPKAELKGEWLPDFTTSVG